MSTQCVQWLGFAASIQAGLGPLKLAAWNLLWRRCTRTHHLWCDLESLCTPLPWACSVSSSLCPCISPPDPGTWHRSDHQLPQYALPRGLERRGTVQINKLKNTTQWGFALIRMKKERVYGSPPRLHSAWYQFVSCWLVHWIISLQYHSRPVYISCHVARYSQTASSYSYGRYENHNDVPASFAASGAWQWTAAW